MNDGNLIGLTGSIGSGKTTVARRLVSLGAYIVDADEISREILTRDRCALARVREAFGDGVFGKDGALDRKKLAAIVFFDAAARERLERIVHPLVAERMLERANALLRDHPDALVVVDVPLLFEAGLEELFSEVLFVDAPQETRIARVMARDGFTREQALARMRAQMSDEEKRVRSHIVFENSGDFDPLYAQVDRWYSRRMGR